MEMINEDMTQLARFAHDMALTAPEDVIKRQALFTAYMELHGRLVAKLAEVRGAAAISANCVTALLAKDATT
jgi:hypothetical protein